MLRFISLCFAALLPLLLPAQSQFFDRPLNPGRLSPGIDVIQPAAGEYLFSSFIPTLSGGPGVNFNLTRLQPAGDILWSKDFLFDRPATTANLTGWPSEQAVLVAGIHFDDNDFPDAAVTKVGYEGNVLWSKSYDLQNTQDLFNLGEAETLLLSDTSFLLAAGSSVFNQTDGSNELSLFKIDEAGELIWGKNYCFSCGQPDSFDLILGNMLAAGDTAFYLSGSIEHQPNALIYQDVFLMKLDSAGNFLWSKSYHIPDSLEFRTRGLEAVLLPGGNLALVGAALALPSDLQDGLILLVDAEGNPIRNYRVNLQAGLNDVYLNHLTAVDSLTIVIPGSSVQDTIPTFGLERNFMFEFRLDSGLINWQANYFNEINLGFLTFENGFEPLPSGYAYLANDALGTESLFPHLIVADLQGRTGCQDSILLSVKPQLPLEIFSFEPQVKSLEEVLDNTFTTQDFDGYEIEVPVLDLGEDDFFCEETEVPLDALVPGAESYAWSTGEDTPEITAMAPGQYFVEDTSGLQCWILRDTISFIVIGPPVVSISVDSSAYCETGEAFLVAGLVNAQSFEWSTGDTINPLPVTQNGVYDLSAENICGTTATGIELVLPDCTPICVLEVPNIFTPDRNGNNDGFRPLSSCETFEEYRLVIYSRWGQLVFESADPAQAWDGAFKEEPMSSDVYGWLLEYRFEGDPETSKIAGEVTLLR